MSLRAETISSACARPSSAQGPATSTSGRLLPKRAAPTATVALGAGSTFMAGDHAPALFRGQRPAQRGESFVRPEIVAACLPLYSFTSGGAHPTSTHPPPTCSSPSSLFP